MQGLLRSCLRPVAARPFASSVTIVSIVDQETRQSLSRDSIDPLHSESDDNSCQNVESAFGSSMHVQCGESCSFLMDFGPCEDLLIKNAEVLGVDLASVSFAVLSTPLSDHGAGLAAFVDSHPDCPVYAHKRIMDEDESEFREFVVKDSRGRIVPVGIDTEVLEGARDSLVLVDSENGILEVANDVFLVAAADCVGFEEVSIANEEYVVDTIPRSLGVVVRQKGGSVLLMGCANPRNGGVTELVKEVQRSQIFEGKYALKYLTGGLHLMYSEENERFLLEDESAFEMYLNHCSGRACVEKLNEAGVLGTVEYFPCGETLEIDSSLGASFRTAETGISDAYLYHKISKKATKTGMKDRKKESLLAAKQLRETENAALKQAKLEMINEAKRLKLDSARELRRVKKESIRDAKRHKKETIEAAKLAKKLAIAEAKATKKADILAWQTEKKGLIAAQEAF